MSISCGERLQGMGGDGVWVWQKHGGGEGGREREKEGKEIFGFLLLFL